MNPTYCLSILVPTIDEDASLRETVEALMCDSKLGSDILEIILITGNNTSDGTLRTCQELENVYGPRVYRITQQLPMLGGAFRSGIARSRGTHLVTMFADLESDPRLVPRMVSESKAFPGWIISASRWLPGGGFRDYCWLKLILNCLFQRVCRLACNAMVTDFTYGFRIYPSPVLKGIPWRETDHAFVLEAILRPHFHRVPIREVPAIWSPRREGRRRPLFRQYLRYLPTVCRLFGRYRLLPSLNSTWDDGKATKAGSIEPGRLSFGPQGETAKSHLVGR